MICKLSRQKPYHRWEIKMYRRRLIIGLLFSFLVSSSSAFMSPASRKTRYRPRSIVYDGTNRQRKITEIYYDKYQSLESHDDDYDDDNIEGHSKKSYWLRWMTVGTPRGVADVKMREADALGGLPRSSRYSSRDWFHSTISLPNSGILRSILSPAIFMTSWATFLSILYVRLKRTNPVAAAGMCIPSTAHSLMMSALGLLLVFRTNSAYQRFAEGRKIWGEIVNSTRDLYRTMMLYEEEIGVEKRRRLQRLLAAFPYLLRHRIRPNLLMHRLDDRQHERNPENTILLYQDRTASEMDPEAAAVATEEENTGKSRQQARPLYWVDKRTLPWRLLPPEALQNCARAQNRPLWVCDRMAEELRKVPDGSSFSPRERLSLIAHVHKLSRCVGECERIHQTAVPLNYARHSLRALTLFLFSLPFALLKDMLYLTGPALLLVSWLLFGVYEIGYSIEDPFQGTLRLSIVCDMIRRDVLADEIIRNTAFQLETIEDKAEAMEDNDNDFEREAEDVEHDEEIDDDTNDFDEEASSATTTEKAEATPSSDQVHEPFS